METLIATKDTKLYDSLTNEFVITIKEGEELGIKADAPLKRKVGAVTRTVTEVYQREVNRFGQDVNHFYWFIPEKVTEAVVVPITPPTADTEPTATTETNTNNDSE